MKSALKHFALFIAVLAFAGMSFAADENLQAATTAAQQWLALVDSGHYGESWDQAASFFKEKVSKQDWLNAMNNGQAPLGKMQSRQFKSAQYETKLPKAPEGNYFVLQFRTKFANASDVVETVTPMLDKDGQWRVSGYYIKPAD
jgi:hypothetical protein